MDIYLSSNLKEAMKNCMSAAAGAILMFTAADSAYAAEASATDPVTLETLRVRGTPFPVLIPIDIPTTFGYDYTSSPSEGSFNPDVANAVRVNANDCAGNPVYRSSGNKVETETDFVGTGEIPLTMQRIYSGSSAAFKHPQAVRGIFGDKWRTSFDYSIELQTTFRIYAWRPNGQRIVFAPSPTVYRRYEELKARGDNWETNPKMYIDTTIGEGGFVTSLVLHTEDGEIETYQTGQLDRYYGAGKIVERKNAQGVSWKFSYSSSLPWGRLRKVEHSSGRSVLFEDSIITDQAGNPYQYVMSDGRLSSVTKPGTPSTTINYHYEDTNYPNALTGKSFNGVRYSTFSYDAEGRATSTEHAGGVERYSFVYNKSPSGTLHVTETNPLGHRSIHAYEDGKKVSVTGEASPHCAFRYRNFTYDTNGNEDVVTDFVGAQTNFDYDEHGHLLRKIEAVGQSSQRTTTYVWDEAKSRIVTVALEGVKRTVYGYDGLDRIASDTVTDLASGQTRTTTYRYTTHPNNLLATYTVDGPLAGSSDALTYSYSSTGDFLSVKNGLGQTVTYSNHNGLGQPGRLADANGAVVEYEYDARGRVVVERTFPNGSPVQTRYVYGASGLLDAKTTSDGNTAYYHYDAARRLVQEDLTEPGGSHAVKRYTYDAMSNPIKIEIGRDN